MVSERCDNGVTLRMEKGGNVRKAWWKLLYTVRLYRAKAHLFCLKLYTVWPCTCTWDTFGVVPHRKRWCKACTVRRNLYRISLL